MNLCSGRWRLRFGFLTALALIACLSLQAWKASRNSDQAHRQNWRHYGFLASKLNTLEHFLGGNIAFLLGVQKLERSYENKGNAEMEALIRSGYLARIQFPVTNLANLREQVGHWFSLPSRRENDES